MEKESAFPSAKREVGALETGMRAYADRKRSMVLWSIVLALVGACALAVKSPYAAVALFVGVMCGVMNALLSMRGNERLLDHRSVASFVFGSVLRVGVFGILPVEFGIRGPWWTIGMYFMGFFAPLSLYALDMARTIRMD
jgi:hypothetical protein